MTLHLDAWILAALSTITLCACGGSPDPRSDTGGSSASGVASGSSGSGAGSAVGGAGGAPDNSSTGSGPTEAGTITSFPLPELAGAPFSASTSSKHTNMGSDGIRLYVSGGDWTHSATDGTWSMSLADGSWRQDVGDPVFPTVPAPHALQDGAGFAWLSDKARFLLWPGGYFAYEEPGTPILEYAKGMWWFDPVKSSYTQELGLFGTYGTTTGNLFGGAYDEVAETIVTFTDSQGAFACNRWDVAQLTALPGVPFSVALEPAQAAYFTRTMHIKVDRHVYVLGYRTKGEPSTQTPLFMRWHLDQQTMEELTPPPVDGPSMTDLEIRLGTSHGKVVWPFMTGPDGDIHGIYVYDPADDSWFVDDQVPDYGNFIGNSVTSLSDDRVVWSGGVFGKQQTHIWFYEAH